MSGFLIEGERDPELKRWVVDLIHQEGRINHSNTPFFVVYLDEEFAIQWYFIPSGDNPQYGESAPTTLNPSEEAFFADGFNLILNDVVRLETLSQGLRKRPFFNWRSSRSDYKRECEEGRELSEDKRDFSMMKARHAQLRATRRLIGESLARTYGKDTREKECRDTCEDPRTIAAKAAIATAQDYLRARSSDVAKSYMINGALLATLVSLIVVILVTAVYSLSYDGKYDRLERGLAVRKLLDEAGKPADAAETQTAAVNIDTTKEQVTVNLPASRGASVQKAPDLVKYATELLEVKTNSMISYTWINRDGWSLTCYSIAGAFGAMLSILMMASKREYDAGAGRMIHMMEGATRILVGILGAAFITVAVKAEVVLGFTTAGTKLGGMVWIHYMFGFLAGASERMVPSFIKVAEAQAQSTSKDKAA